MVCKGSLEKDSSKLIIDNVLTTPVYHDDRYLLFKLKIVKSTLQGKCELLQSLIVLSGLLKVFQ